jgi:tetratricopeptide (TPR) repeat protein
LGVALEDYRQTLDALGDNSQTLLSVLLTRDRVKVALGQTRPLPVDSARQLVGLDGQLRQRVAEPALESLPGWRQTFHPPDTHWWWFLDQKAEEREQRNDLPWVLLTGTLLLLTATLTAEILRRLWDGAPDFVSIFGTLLTLTLTASPLVKRGPELAQWFFERISWLKPRFRAEAMASMAALAFVAVLAVRLLLPQLAIVYNNQGFAALQAGNLTRAQQKFQRAVALDPEQAVSYYNLAEVYQDIARPDDAQTWYQKSIEHNLNFAPAYRGLGHLHNAQGEHQQAEEVLLVGLSHVGAGMEEKETEVARYELLSELGWALFAQEDYARAQRALEEAIALEDKLRAFEDEDNTQHRLALPHYYLAQIYEQQERAADALQQWEDCLRLVEHDWASQGWHATAQEHIEILEEEQK